METSVTLDETTMSRSTDHLNPSETQLDAVDTVEESPYDNNNVVIEDDSASVRSVISQLDEPSTPAGPKLKGQKFVLSESNTEVYVTHSPSKKYPKLVVLLTNSLGLSSINNLRLADAYSEQLNLPIIVPDLFDGDPIRTSAADIDDVLGTDSDLESQEDLSEPAAEEDAGLTDPERKRKPSVIWSKLATVTGLKSLAANVAKGFVDEMWLARHTYEKTHPNLSAVLSEIIQIYSPQSLGVIGYSFGGKYVLGFLEDVRNNEWSSDEDLITVGAAIHPTLINAKDFDKVSKPFMLVHGKHDDMLPESVIKAGELSMRERNVEFSTTAFESTDHHLPHGFAVPGDYSEKLVDDKPLQVVSLVSSWISEHL